MAGLTAVDASVLIAFLDDSDTHHRAAVDALIAIERFVVDPITLAEVLVHPVRLGREHDVLHRLTAIGMEVSQTPHDAVALAQLRVKAGLKMPDCIVVALGQRHGGEVLSFHRGVQRASEP